MPLFTLNPVILQDLRGLDHCGCKKAVDGDDYNDDDNDDDDDDVAASGWWPQVRGRLPRESVHAQPMRPDIPDGRWRGGA